MPSPVTFTIDRSRPLPIAEQITVNLRNAITEGRLEPGARLPSWLDMATQLGVSRGTVKAAYERLVDEELVVSSGASGTRVAELPPSQPPAPTTQIPRPLLGIERGFYLKPLPFQMGVPAQDAFPAKLWSRLRTRAVRDDAMAPVGMADPRGHPELRAQIAGYLAIARGIRCQPDQVILTSGYKNGLCLALLTLQAHGRKAWMEDPGFPLARMALGPPANAVIEVGGPEKFRLNELIARVLAHDKSALRVVLDPQAAYFGVKLGENSLIPGPGARLGSTSFAWWLENVAPPPAHK